jgi:hypothetical protein
VVKATIDALRQLETPERVASRRGKSTDEIAPSTSNAPALRGGASARSAT